MQVPGPSIRNSFRMQKGLILDDPRMKTSIDDAFAAVSTVCGGPIRSRANLVLSLSLSLPRVRSRAPAAHGPLPPLRAPGPGEGAAGRDPHAAAARLPQGLPPLPVTDALPRTASATPPRAPGRGRRALLPSAAAMRDTHGTALDAGSSVPLCDIGGSVPHATSPALLGERRGINS